jgi:hypothetical protein
VSVANLSYALFAAQRLDATSCSIGVATMATVLVGDDPTAKMMLAKEMRRLADELDPYVVESLQ